MAVGLQSGSHGMSGQQAIDFIDRGAADGTAMFPGNQFRAEPLSQIEGDLANSSASRRAGPSFLKLDSVVSAEQASGAKPSQQSFKVWEQFDGLIIYNRVRVDEVQRSLVPQE